MKFCYSLDEEEYRGEYDSREEALAEALEYTQAGFVWTAAMKPAMDFLRGRERYIGEMIAETIDEWLFDDIASEDSIVELDAEGTAELGKLVLEFLEKRAAFTRWGVDDVQHHKVEQEPTT